MSAAAATAVTTAKLKIRIQQPIILLGVFIVENRAYRSDHLERLFIVSPLVIYCCTQHIDASVIQITTSHHRFDSQKAPTATISAYQQLITLHPNITTKFHQSGVKVKQSYKSELYNKNHWSYHKDNI